MFGNDEGTYSPQRVRLEIHQDFPDSLDWSINFYSIDVLADGFEVQRRKVGHGAQRYCSLQSSRAHLNIVHLGRQKDVHLRHERRVLWAAHRVYRVLGVYQVSDNDEMPTLSEVGRTVARSS